MAGITRAEAYVIEGLVQAHAAAIVAVYEAAYVNEDAVRQPGAELPAAAHQQLLADAELEVDRTRAAIASYLQALLLPGAAADHQAQDHDERQQKPVHEPLPVVPGRS